MRLRRLEVVLAGLPSELDGLRIVHLSDFHLGPPSRGRVAVERAVEWAAGPGPDLVVITGDLLTHPRASRTCGTRGRLQAPTFAVLGNHDLAISRDPQARRSNLRELAPARSSATRAAGRAARPPRLVAGLHPR